MPESMSDELIEFLDQALLDGNVDKVNKFLAITDPACLHTAEIIAILSATHPFLENYSDFLEKSIAVAKRRSFKDLTDIQSFKAKHEN